MLEGKVVVVTGGAGLLGTQFCNGVARDGALVVVADQKIENACAVAQAICAAGGKAEAVAIDITDAATINALIDSIHLQHGKIDAVVNNAYPRNKNYGRRVEEVAYADFCENMSLHAGGYFLVMQQFGAYFQKHGGGNIVNLASIYGVMAPRFEVYDGTSMTMPVEYAAIKSAVIGLTRYFAQFYKRDGIRVNCLSPGGILDHQPESFVQRYGQHCGTKGMLDAQDILGTLVYLLSDASRHVTGQNLVVDDGFSL
jgi:NAD(P)-dependent dehydrogenase (short-subunit alcohol dehydrogenase family)